MAGFEVNNRDSGGLLVSLNGELTPEVCEQLRSALGEHLSAAPGTVLIDLRGVSECGVFARSVLVKIQTDLASSGARTAYLADSPRFRGLALWVAHLAEDPGAKSVLTEDQANEWLAGTDARLDRANVALGVKK